MNKHICELCGKGTELKGKIILEVEKSKLEEFWICRECYEEISEAQTQAEIDKIKEIKERYGNDIC